MYVLVEWILVNFNLRHVFILSNDLSLISCDKCIELEVTTCRKSNEHNLRHFVRSKVLRYKG